MHIRSVVLNNFMSHASTALEFPAQGVVVVRGDNGSGKSAIVEAVATALWGETLRGVSPWVEGKAGNVRVVTDAVRAARNRTAKGKQAVEWAAVGAEPEVFDTATKAQEALGQMLLPWDVWRRAAVFSSADASHFTLAPDAARKRLLEQVLGLERLDAASERCRAQLRNCEYAHAKASSVNDVRRANVAGARKRLADADAALAELGGDAGVTITEAEDQLRDARGGLIGVRKQIADMASGVPVIRKLRDAASKADAQVGVARRAFHLAEQGNCPTCAQAIPGEYLVQATKELNAARATAKRASEELVVAETAREQERASLADTEQLLANEVRSLEQAIAENRAASERRDGAAKRRATVERDLAVAEGDLEAGEIELEDATAAYAVMSAANLALGLTGVRAQLLGGALDAVTQVANSWLLRVAGAGLALELKPYAEKASGGVKDSISLEIRGAGGGRGYRGASGGERRRIDLAMLLALGELAAAAHGAQPGTIFMDEVDFGLDPDGTAALVGVIEELAEERCVVVITHGAAFAKLLRPAQRWSVDGGVVAVGK